MKHSINFFLNSLIRYSKSLEKKSIFVDQPWALLDSDLKIQKLIFKNNKELIMSIDGKATVGSWDYLPEAKSLLIDRVTDKILLNEGFINEGIMILKLDGTKNEFVVLANENVVPDLDAFGYLHKLMYKSLNITTRKLTNGKILEVTQFTNMHTNPMIGNKVTIDGDEVPDGEYDIQNSNSKYIVRNSCITSIIFEYFYDTKKGPRIMIQQHHPATFKKGNKAFIDAKPAPDGKYRIIAAWNIIVKNGIIVRTTPF